ncbi:MAG: type II secretion system protein GspG [Candidatus Omnitrophica bacterium]|nr:type II secretion system protein GspG [Candidatus Omnitrophota bacterium]
MIVVGLIGLLAALAVIGVSRHRQDAEDTRMQAELSSIYKAMEAYRFLHGRYPTTYAELREFISIPDFAGRYEINPSP